MALLSQGFSNNDPGRLGLLYVRFFVKYFFCIWSLTLWSLDFFLESWMISQFLHKVTVNCTVLCKMSAVIVLLLVFPNWSSPLKLFPEEKRGEKKKSTAHIKKKPNPQNPSTKTTIKPHLKGDANSSGHWSFLLIPNNSPRGNFTNESAGIINHECSITELKICIAAWRTLISLSESEPSSSGGAPRTQPLIMT